MIFFTPMLVERLDVLHAEHLEDVLVAGAAGLVAVAHLARAEDREVDAGALQQLRERARRLLVAVVEAARAADEVEVLVVERAAGLDDVDAFERRGPVAPLALVHAVRVRRVLHRAERVAELGREVALHQREVAAHVEDLVEDLDVHRADLVARLAARARPQLFGRDAFEHAVGADRDLGVDADRRRHRPGSPVAAITSPTFSTISRGSSGLPVACAGHTDVQRPQIVHASVSKSCFHVKSSIFTAPKLSSSVSMRFGIGFIAPLGRSRSFRYMFIGDVNMWRSFVVGIITRNAEERDDVHAPHPLVRRSRACPATTSRRASTSG